MSTLKEFERVLSTPQPSADPLPQVAEQFQGLLRCQLNPSVIACPKTSDATYRIVMTLDGATLQGLLWRLREKYGSSSELESLLATKVHSAKEAIDLVHEFLKRPVA